MASSRHHPPRYWAEMVQALTAAAGYHVILTDSANNERNLIRMTAPMPHPLVQGVAGTLELGQWGALIEQAPVVISSDNGLAHLAAALGTPLVNFYALTNPQHTPRQVPSRVLFHDASSRNCYKSVCPEGHHACWNYQWVGLF